MQRLPVLFKLLKYRPQQVSIGGKGVPPGEEGAEGEEEAEGGPPVPPGKAGGAKPPGGKPPQFGKKPAGKKKPVPPALNMNIEVLNHRQFEVLVRGMTKGLGITVEDVESITDRIAGVTYRRGDN